MANIKLAKHIDIVKNEKNLKVFMNSMRERFHKKNYFSNVV